MPLILKGYKLAARNSLLTAFLLLTGCSKPIQPSGSNQQTGSTTTVNHTEFLRLVNDARKKGCQCGDTWYPAANAVSWNDQLEAAAFAHSTDMNKKSFFNHTGSDGSNAGERIKRAGYQWKVYGENIGNGYKTEKEVINGWLSSPGHCRNIMNRDFNEIGLAKVGKYWTMDAGRK